MTSINIANEKKNSGEEETSGESIRRDIRETALHIRSHHYTEEEKNKMREAAEEERQRIMELVKKYKRDENEDVPLTFDYS